MLYDPRATEVLCSILPLSSSAFLPCAAAEASLGGLCTRIAVELNVSEQAVQPLLVWGLILKQHYLC